MLQLTYVESKSIPFYTCNCIDFTKVCSSDTTVYHTEIMNDGVYPLLQKILTGFDVGWNANY